MELSHDRPARRGSETDRAPPLMVHENVENPTHRDEP
jgi:hypothetical protein